MKTTLMNIFGQLRKGLFSAALITLLSLSVPADLAHAADSNYDYEAQTLRVGLWIENLDEGEVLERGQEIDVGFQANEDAYAVVYRINAEGLVSVLWPRSRMDDGFVFAGHEYMMPVTGGRRLTASSETGEGFIEAIVSRYPFDLRELALDFHHEYQEESFDFFVAGDPFLAINEVNFAITGMEDSADFVVTNYMSYFVHQAVDHPRYLCNQCHIDDDLAQYPYRDECAIDIDYDYNWGNEWYEDVGYYPIYHNPVYVYYDPWTWRPWVNFWYDPYYRCPTIPGYHWNYNTYVWCDSPYYKYDGVRQKTGRGLYNRPNQGPSQGSGRKKTSDFRGVTGRVAQSGPTDGERENMRQKNRTPSNVSSGSRVVSTVRNPGSSMIARGEKPVVRVRPNIETPDRGTSRGGLQIRNTGGRKPTTARGSRETTNSNPTVGTNPVRSGGTSGGSMVRPGRGYSSGGQSGSSSGGNTTVHGSSRPEAGSNSTVKPTRGTSGEGRIKPVEPRKKGTRIWNSRSGSSSGERKVRNTTGNSSGNSSSRNNSSGARVQPRSGNSNNNRSNNSTPKVQPKSNSRSSSGSSGSSGSSSGSSRSGGSSKSGSSSGKSKSSSSKSGRDGGSSRAKR